jgi:hypothetical protein
MMPEPSTRIDLKRLAAEVSVQHGIRMDPDDPMMAVVTLNRLVFEQAVSQVLERVQSAVADFEAATDKVQVRAGGILAQEVRDCALTIRQEFASIENSRCGGSTSMIPAASRWMVAGLALALALFGAGVWVGTVMRGSIFLWR